MKTLAKRMARMLGYEVIAYSLQRNHTLRKMALLRRLEVNLVIDAGANRGQYASDMRRLGYKGRIVSLEPHPVVYPELCKTMSGDPAWSGLNVAIGEQDGEVELFTPSITEVSSLLPAVGAGQTEGWKTQDRTKVRQRAMRTLMSEVAGASDVVHWKLDVQGYEQQALHGAGDALSRCVSLELELSTVPLYHGETSMPAVLFWLHQAGYDVHSLEPICVDHRHGQILQVETLMVRRDLSPLRVGE